jgi:hypothetical protein
MPAPGFTPPWPTPIPINIDLCPFVPNSVAHRRDTHQGLGDIAEGSKQFEATNLRPHAGRELG